MDHNMDVQYQSNLVPRVLGLFGQRVSAGKGSGIMDSIFTRKREFRSYWACLSLNGNRKEKTVKSRNGGLKLFEKQKKK